MAKIYRSADYLYAPYALDACSNVVIEARMCGMEIVVGGVVGREVEGSSTTEILRAPLEQLTLKAMGDKYLEVFERVLNK